jgi:hypothetical protein
MADLSIKNENASQEKMRAALASRLGSLQSKEK